MLTALSDWIRGSELHLTQFLGGAGFLWLALMVAIQSREIGELKFRLRRLDGED
jgi:hypothetical protein